MTPAAGEKLDALADVVGERGESDAAEHVARSFKRAMGAVRRLRGRETHRPGELTDAQYSLLFCLRDQTQMSVRDLAEAADLSPASVTEMLEGLAAAGLVERHRSDRDRRVVFTALTAEGRGLVEERRARFDRASGPQWRGSANTICSSPPRCSTVCVTFSRSSPMSGSSITGFSTDSRSISISSSSSSTSAPCSSSDQRLRPRPRPASAPTT